MTNAVCDGTITHGNKNVNDQRKLGVITVELARQIRKKVRTFCNSESDGLPDDLLCDRIHALESGSHESDTG